MDTDEVEFSLRYVLRKSLVKAFYVIGRDELPNVQKKALPIVIVVNTDDSDKKGLHWTAFFVKYINNKVVGYFFDSYANSYKHYGFEPPFKIIDWSRRVLQSPSSSTCGLWSILFLHHMYYSHSVKSFESMFSNNLCQNESKLIKMINSLYIPINTIIPIDQTSSKCVMSCCPRTLNNH